MGDILPIHEFDAVRHAVGVDADVVPDTLIDGLYFLPVVEDRVKELVPDWSTILAGDDADTRRLQTAVASWVGARVCLYLERQEGLDYRLGPYTQRPTDVDWPEKAAALGREAAGALSQLTTVAAASRPTFFTRTGPTRARTRVPTTFEEWLDKIQPLAVDWLEDLQT